MLTKMLLSFAMGLFFAILRGGPVITTVGILYTSDSAAISISAKEPGTES